MAQQAKLKVLPQQRLGRVSPYIYGTATYASGTDAFWVGEGSKIPNIQGFRKETVEYLKRLSPQVTSYYPGLIGTWEEMVGPRDKRPPRFDPLGRAVFEETPMERNPDFGIDEFLQFCELIGSDAMLRISDEDFQDGRHLVEYCNYEGTSKYAQMRKANGHPEPYRVKFWQWYAWMDAAEHARSFRSFAWIARCIDPEIQVLCAEPGVYGEQFFEELLKIPESYQDIGGTSLVDYICSINYLAGFDDEMDFREETYYRIMHNASGIEQFFLDSDALIQRYAEGRKPFGRFQTIDWLGRPASNERMCIGVTEWGISHRFKRGTFRDALVSATILDIYNRLSAIVPIATLTWTANMGSALLITKGEVTLLTPMYHLFDMYRVHKSNEALAVSIECDQIRPESAEKEVDTVPFAGGTIKELPPLPVVSASASMSPLGNELFLSATNRHLEDDVEVEISIEGAGEITSGRVSSLTARQIEDCNDVECPHRIEPATEPFTHRSSPFRMVLPAHSIHTLSLTLK